MQNRTSECRWCLLFFAVFLLIDCTIPETATAAPVPQSDEQADHLRFEVTVGDLGDHDTVSGRLYVFLSTGNRQPMNGPNWFSPEPFYALDVSDVRSGDTITIDDGADGFPGKLSDVAAGNYYVQVILDHDFYHSSAADGGGNFFSDPVQMQLNGTDDVAVPISLTREIPQSSVDETDWMKLVRIESELLSAFHERQVFDQALVLLPAGYDDNPDRRYPVYYDITGFGGSLEGISRGRRNRPPAPAAEGDAEFIRVYLDGQCKWGHHVYANSATNGPRGDALVQELIPAIDSRFRTIAQTTARFVGGHSSGGWSSLWLQVNYPDAFGGVWSTAPDPVDFRDFQQTDIYNAEDNFFFFEDGSKKPLARRGTVPMIWYPDFCKMDDTLGRGGQMRSFEAAFSPLDANGKPARCWLRGTGNVNVEVAEYWKRYDISLILKENWEQLEPKLAGKLHVYMGTLDTFYLDGATVLLKERMEELGSDAVIEMFEGRDHSNILSRDFRARINQEMTRQFRRHHPDSE